MGIRQNTLLSAFLLSDGGVSSKNQKSWTLYFRNKDIMVNNLFRQELLNCLGKQGFITRRKDGSLFVRATINQEKANELFSISNSYRTKACENSPKCKSFNNGIGPCKICKPIFIGENNYPLVTLPEILFKNKKLAIKFIKIYATCDGGISVTVTKNKRGSRFLIRKIFISVKHPLLKDQLANLLKFLEFSPSVYKDQIRLTKKEDILKFKKNIGFITKAKISGDSKILKGLEKNYVLEKVAESYQNPHELMNFLLKRKSLVRLKRD